jgi:DNA (cytosine-5)-methyltransferase 1
MDVTLSEPRLLSLFSGGGGLDMAAELLWPDLHHVAFSELDLHAAACFTRWRPDVPNLGDVTAVDWTKVGPVDVLTAGFPCQDISHAGKRAGIKEGTRSGLWFSVVDAVRHLRPRLVLLENVAAIASPGGGLDVVLGSLAEVGWSAEWGVLRASDVGAPHGRARWFCVAYPEVDGWPEGRTGAGERPRHPGQPASHRSTSADAVSVRSERRGDPGDMASTPRAGEADREQRERDGDAPDHRSPVAADPDLAGLEGRSALRSGAHELAARSGSVDAWGDYGPAIARWERIVGRWAPAPTDHRGRLFPPFVEWMMGWPAGHVDQLPRSQALKVLGNGVVPLQAAHAYTQLLERGRVRGDCRMSTWPDP